MATRILLTRRIDVETGRAQMPRQPRGQFGVETPDVNQRFAETPVHGEHDLAARRHGQTIRMVELVTGDVQVAVRTVRLQSFEAEETVFRARDRVGNFGSAGFDHAAVRRDDQRRRMRSSARSDAIIAALHLVAREFRV